MNDYASYEYAKFSISSDNVRDFKRWIKKPQDCVINALELLKIVDSRTADIMRIITGDFGISQDHVEEIFNYSFPQKQWSFLESTEIQNLSDIVADMPAQSSIFCGYEDPEKAHVFIIAKTDKGSFYIDPQLPIDCNLQVPQCLGLIEDKTKYYVLHYRENECENE
jgi:hypothetical protein